jgi:hypothetical protein
MCYNETIYDNKGVNAIMTSGRHVRTPSGQPGRHHYKKAPRPSGRSGGTSRSQELPVQFFVAVLCVFLLLCAINLIEDSTDGAVHSPAAATELAYTPGEPESFFKALAPIATNYADDYDLYASVMLAQAAIESDYGRSQLTATYNNYFGIKAHDNNQSVLFKTTEYENGKKMTVTDGFSVYPSADRCFFDYARLLGLGPTYASVRQAASPQEAAWALQTAGYATDPSYASKIISIIDEYDLTKYDSK